VDGKFYIGFTSKLEERIRKHEEGVIASTAPRRPLKLIFYEVYLNRYDALRREKYLKTSKGRTTLKSMLRKYLAK
jgi:putative endonuclease